MPCGARGNVSHLCVNHDHRQVLLPAIAPFSSLPSFCLRLFVSPRLRQVGEYVNSCLSLSCEQDFLSNQILNKWLTHAAIRNTNCCVIQVGHFEPNITARLSSNYFIPSYKSNSSFARNANYSSHYSHDIHCLPQSAYPTRALDNLSVLK